ncbi:MULTISPECIES: SWIM zinc finger family protein [Streptomyces]|uniref:SWIM zinc finger family protein n=1 Tax=Streptomyces rimosus subsp. rimosus (strain ATCC 10970 / DSM 40260 / JCM 4667 / NRRL 2234) TaxID=1265868 RepID=A0A8A1UT44_STRR1|nr:MULTISPECIES: SWIM zinc finger family protein [Streptomyces]KOG76800.1 SWIM zinc finger domain protein [Kitasatospora aureofaciens]MYT42543.1 SWIM zinc finger family protein [Streptomyces sp. SID5471]KOT36412.1 SWIM zinc finger domain protein [Streptomyces sp. NRRL WC-3701]KOT45089.1 SWIM zinc finger domain protein [Streptomyces rimosus subsp. rimosus]KOT66165.1 SWIM zinc finger domain protein [Streptomyces rimosus subsp. rimosus]
MNSQGERWTSDHVLALAPDAPSRKAGSRLATRGSWPETGTRGSAVWGLCKGSGSKPYQTVVDTAGPAFKCSCPSRKFPCKHALGLLLMWAGEEGAVGEGEPPAWVTEWLAARQQRAEKKTAAASNEVSGDGSSDSAPSAANQDAARRRAALRVQRIAAGATELEQRLEDLLRSGLATADRAGYGTWDETAARMVDAQAPGLAARVRELGSAATSGPDWPSRLLAECSLIHLLDQAFLGVERLPPALAATVRTRVGLTTDASDVLAGADTMSVRDRWLVLAQQDTEEGMLTSRRIWLRGERTGRMALHLSFGGRDRPLDLSLPRGLVLDADLAYYPGARPLRVVLGTRHADPVPAGGPPPGGGTDAALAAYGHALRDDPWLDAWPVVLTDVVPIPGRDGEPWQLADADGESALPVDPRCTERAGLWRLAAISGGEPVTVFGECGHRGFVPLTTWDPEPVAL